MLSIDTSKIEYDKVKCYKRNCRNFSEDSFIANITIQKWYNDFKNVNDCYNDIDFIFRLEGCVNRHAPIKKLNQKEQKSNQKPWITNEILKKIKPRNKLFAQREGNPNDVNIKRIYVLFRNAINRDNAFNNFFVNVGPNR